MNKKKHTDSQAEAVGRHTRQPIHEIRVGENCLVVRPVATGARGGKRLLLCDGGVGLVGWMRGRAHPSTHHPPKYK